MVRLFTTFCPVLYFMVATCTTSSSDDADWGGFEPEFIGVMSNVTVPVGRDAVLSCTVANLGGHKVGWVKADTKAIQAIHLTVVTHNPRVSAEHVGSNQWKLIIRNVRVEDAGFYMAQINTDPMTSQMVYLDVTQSPDIIDAQTPAEVRVREGEALKLSCHARGNPTPRITWKREDGHDIGLHYRDDPKTGFGGRNNKSHQATTGLSSASSAGSGSSYDGEVLRITQVTKRHMGIYHCIATNGVPPSVSKRVAVTVLFAPTVTVDNQIVGVPLGANVSVGCIVESSPKSINVWYKDDKMMANGSRWSYEERMEATAGYRVKMVLTISHFRKADAGRYECRSRNEMGEADASAKVHDLPPLKTTTTTTPAPIFYNVVTSGREPTTARPTWYVRTTTAAAWWTPHPTQSRESHHSGTRHHKTTTARPRHQHISSSSASQHFPVGLLWFPLTIVAVIALYNAYPLRV